MSLHTIGVDVGNFDTKSAHTSTVSGFAVYNSKQLLAEESSLLFNGKCYVESIGNRFPYVEDKTVDEQSLILTLFSISKEIIWRIRNELHLIGNGIQNEINNYSLINLGVGLPPGHFSKLAQKTRDYYLKYLKNGVTYEYAGFRFSFKVNQVQVYPQGLAAVVLDDTITIAKGEGKVKKYYIVDIGGYTADIVPIVDGAPEVENCRSLSIGTRRMFETIIARIQSSSGITLEEASVEDVLRNEKTFIKDEIKDEIKENARQHAHRVIDRCLQAGCAFDSYPVVFVGGGCALLSEYLKETGKICYCEFINDVHANADKYEKFMKMENMR